jgi:hypothetical protein
MKREVAIKLQYGVGGMRTGLNYYAWPCNFNLAQKCYAIAKSRIALGA